MNRIILLLVLILHKTVAAQTKNFSIDGGFIISHFQQQVKQEVGDRRGERLVHENEFGFLISGRYSFNEYLSAGLFLRMILEKEKQLYLMDLILRQNQNKKQTWGKLF